MVELTREETIKVLDCCDSNEHNCETSCPLFPGTDAECAQTIAHNVLRFFMSKKEPAPSGNGTSPNVNPYKMYNTTKINKCQDLLGKSVKLIDTNNMRDIGEALAYIKIVAEMLSEED